MKHNIIHYLVTIGWYFLKDTPQVVIFTALMIGGYLIFRTDKQPVSLVLGLPLMLGGGGLTLQKLWSMVLVFSPTFNRGVCPFCHHKSEE